MELFGHVTLTYYALRNAGLSNNDVIDFLHENSAKLCLTDTIRCKLTSTPVKFGRIYTHFTNGGYMRFPIADELKNSSFDPESICSAPESYTSSIADGPTDFASFIAENPHLFTQANRLWGLCILSHLQQDAISDYVFQQLTAKFGNYSKDKSVLIHGKYEAKEQEVTYTLTGRKVTGDVFRKNVSQVSLLFHRTLVKRLSTDYGMTTKDVLQIVSAAHKSFEEAYEEKMAVSAKGYLKQNPLWFADVDADGKTSIKTIEDEVIDSGFCSNLDELRYLLSTLLEEGTTACKPLINTVVYGA